MELGGNRGERGGERGFVKEKEYCENKRGNQG